MGLPYETKQLQYIAGHADIVKLVYGQAALQPTKL
jgi:hypothetical protein